MEAAAFQDACAILATDAEDTYSMMAARGRVSFSTLRNDLSNRPSAHVLDKSKALFVIIADDLP